ncbi:thioredoxin family protein [Paenibacillus lautus]
MTTPIHLRHKIGQGLSPRQFTESMKSREMKLSSIPNTKEQFRQVYDRFQWDDEEVQRFFAGRNERGQLHCLILCTDWCPDVIWNVPVLFRVMEYSRIPTEVLIMDEHLETMDLFLTDGGRAQPIALFLNAATGAVLGQWGARPAYIQNVMDEFKRNYDDQQAGSYQEQWDQVYTRIGELYHDGNEYRKVLLQELKERFTSFA